MPSRKPFFLFFLLAFVPPAHAAPPKLIVILVGDQVRADYLERFHSQLAPDGLRRFRDQGTYYTHARMDHAVTKTSPGHVLIGSGLYAAQSGIVSNEWYDCTSSMTAVPSALIPGGAHTQLVWYAGRSLAQRMHLGLPYTRVVGVSLKDRAALLTFFDFPAEHWDHLRTSNPIESVFATVRQRAVRTKGALSAKTAKLMVFKLVNAAAKTWRRLKGENQLPKVVQGVKFQNGIEVIKMPAHHAA